MDYLVLPTSDGSPPRESDLGRELFDEYIKCLELPPDKSFATMRRIMRRVRRRSSSGSVHHRQWSRKDRRCLRAFGNWAEYRPESAWTDHPRRSARRHLSDEVVSNRDSNRRKVWTETYQELVPTNWSATSQYWWWAPKKESDPIPTRSVVRQFAIDYQVGPLRPFRPLSGSSGDARVPVLCGELPRYEIGYEGFEPKVLSPYRWEIPQPKLLRTYSWNRLGLARSIVDIAPSTTDVSLARANALASLYANTPHARPNFLRSILELKDLRSSAVGLCDLFKWGNRLLRQWHGRPAFRVVEHFTPKRGRWREFVPVHVSGQESVAQIAGAYLNAMFGVLPTASDLRLYLRKLAEGIDPFSQDSGGPPNWGAVLKSHYVVSPRQPAPDFVRGGWKTVNSGEIAWLNEAQARKPSKVVYSIGTADVKFLASAQTVQRTTVRGTVFAKMHSYSDLSKFFIEHFGHIGHAWSYPALTTAWELTPWSWLVDWFTDARRHIRVAERMATTWWARMGFEDPWIFESTIRTRYYPWVSCSLVSLKGPTLLTRGDTSWPFRLVLSPRVAFTANYRKGDTVRYFQRGPYEGFSPPTRIPTRMRCKARLFQISIGMALVAQSAASSRRMRDLIDSWSDHNTAAGRRLVRSIEANRRQQRIADEVTRELEWLESLEDTL